MYTPEMTQAERELDGRIEHALRVAGRVRAQVASFQRAVAEQPPPTDEEVDRVRTFVLGHAEDAEWRPVLDRIARGELTWRDVVEGLATGTADRAVVAAFDALPASTPETVAALFPACPPEPPPAPPKPAHEDEYFEDPLRLRRR